jgi:hypothetical protein
MSKKWKKSRLTFNVPLKAASPPNDFRIIGASEPIEIKAAEAEGKMPLFAMTAYTGVPMKLEGFYHPVVVDLDSAQAPRQTVPVPMGHNTDKIVGHTSSIEITQQRIYATGVVSGSGKSAQKVVALAKNGFPWQASIGANAKKMEYVDKGDTVKVNGRNWEGPLYVARGAVIREISMVPMGADGNTSAAVAASYTGETNMEFTAWLTARGFDPAKLSDEVRTGLRAAFDAEQKLPKPPEVKAEPPKVDISAAVEAELKAARERAAAEFTRQGEIVARVKKHDPQEVEIDGADGKKVKLAQAAFIAHAITANMTPDQAELLALRCARPTPPKAPFGYSATTPEATDAVFEAAILQASRHQFRLEDDSFYLEASPDGKGMVRRVPERLQRQAQGELKARYTDHVQQAAHTLYKGQLSLHAFFRDALRCAGITGEYDMRSETGIRSMLQAWGANDIRAAGASNLSISNILANVLNKFAMQGYLFTEQAWREIAGIRPVRDFKPTKSINLLGQAMYKQIGPTGELANAGFTDQAFANQANPYGIIATIPWVHLVNDDLGMLTGVPTKIGQGAGLALNDYFWALWASLASGSVVGVIPSGTSLNGDDGNAFWRTTSSTTAAAKRAGTAYLANKDSGAALSATTLKSGKALFDNQIDPNGNPLGFDAAMPILLFGPSNWSQAMTLMQSPVLVAAGLASTSAFTSAPSNNIWAGSMRPVMSRYIENASYGNSTTAFWLLFNPAALPVIEVSFLNGVDTPAVLQAGPDFQFDRLGISIRGTMPFGVSQQNFRGGVYNAGA